MMRRSILGLVVTGLVNVGVAQTPVVPPPQGGTAAQPTLGNAKPGNGLGITPTNLGGTNAPALGNGVTVIPAVGSTIAPNNRNRQAQSRIQSGQNQSGGFVQQRPISNGFNNNNWGSQNRQPPTRGTGNPMGIPVNPWSQGGFVRPTVYTDYDLAAYREYEATVGYYAGTIPRSGGAAPKREQRRR